MALILKRKGITRVRPLAGGFERWRSESLPLVGVPKVQIGKRADAARAAD